eukprot:scpid57406/ scgid31878/ 
MSTTRHSFMARYGHSDKANSTEPPDVRLAVAVLSVHRRHGQYLGLRSGDPDTPNSASGQRALLLFPPQLPLVNPTLRSQCTSHKKAKRPEGQAENQSAERSGRVFQFRHPCTHTQTRSFDHRNSRLLAWKSHSS